MARRNRVPVPLGAGLDRATGAGAVDPRTLKVALNLVAREAAVALRPGFQPTGLPDYDPAEATNVASDIVWIGGMQATKDVLHVTYDRTTRKVLVWRINPVGPTKQFVTTWGTLDVAASFPVITAAESYGKLFFAHADPVLGYRLATGYYTPNATDATVGSWTTLQADLNGDSTPADVKFYAVAAHGAYLAGAGWGTETDTASQDRPEIVRLSVGADPTTFRPETYFIAGPRGERIEGLLSMTDGLACSSARQRYVIFGESPADFGVKIADPNFGQTSARAGVVVGGDAFQWSAAGPRRLRSALLPSEDIAIPLDVFGALPSGAVAAGPDRLRFGAYDPVERLLYFLAPDPEVGTTTSGAVASLRNVEVLRWTSCTLQRVMLAAGPFYAKVAPAAGTGYASSVSAVDGGWEAATDGRKVTLSWTNSSTVGTETAEVWQQTAGGTWAVLRSIAVAGSSQSTVITGLDPLTAYAWAIRMVTIAGGVTSGYTGTPDIWSAGTAAGAQTTLTTSASTPALDTAITPFTFVRSGPTTATLTILATGADSRCPLSLERNTGTGWVEIRSDLTATYGATLTISVDATPFLELATDFRLRHKRGAATGSYSNTLARFGGLQNAAPALDHVFDTSTTTRAVEVFARALSGGGIEIEVVGGSRTLFPSRLTTRGYAISTALTGTGTVTVRARHARLTAGVYDYSAWSSTTSRTCTPGGTAPAAAPVDATTIVYPGTMLDEDASPGPFFGNLTYLEPFPYGRNITLVRDSEPGPYRRRASNPTSADLLCLFDHGESLGYTAVRITVGGDQILVEPQVGGTLVVYQSLAVALVNPVTLMRGPWTDVPVPTA